jgi:hypothetical protein
VHLNMEQFKALPMPFTNLPDRVQVLGNPSITQELDIAYDSRTYKPMALMLVANYIELKAKETSEWLDYECYSSEQAWDSEILPLPRMLSSTTALQTVQDPKTGQQVIDAAGIRQAKEAFHAGKDVVGVDDGSGGSAMENYIPTPVHGHSVLGLGAELEETIQTWCQRCMKQYYHLHRRPHHGHGKARIFRRSLIISFVSAFIEHQTQADIGGHAITLAMEAGGGSRWFKLFVFDYRAHEYLYSVHDQLFWCMHHAVLHNEYRLICNVHSSDIRWETVPLRGRLHYGDQFMMCMSLSFRVCMYLSYVRDCFDMLESRAAFDRDAKVFTHNVYTMLNALLSHPDVTSGALVVMQSPQMAYSLFKVTMSRCYLMLVKQADASVGMDTPRIEMWGLLEKAVSTLHFAGLKPSGELVDAAHVFRQKHARRAGER